MRIVLNNLFCLVLAALVLIPLALHAGFVVFEAIRLTLTALGILEPIS